MKIKTYQKFISENISRTDQEDIEEKIRILVNKIDNKIEFEKELILSNRFIIVGIQPDKIHGDLKVFYRDKYDHKVKKVDFFDFHPEEYSDLYAIIKQNIPIQAYYGL